MKGGVSLNISNALVVGMGMGTVFIGLICLILICYFTGVICNALSKKPQVAEKPVAAQPVSAMPIQNKQEILAACCAIIAEEIGTEANNIKVVSFKRV